MIGPIIIISYFIVGILYTVLALRFDLPRVKERWPYEDRTPAQIGVTALIWPLFIICAAVVCFGRFILFIDKHTSL